MPNQNPAGSNQPLDQRPLPSLERHVIGADQLIAPSIVDNVDLPIITVPPDDVVREVGRITIHNGSAEILLFVNLIYKDSSGNEVILRTQVANLAAGGTRDLDLPDASFFLTSDDAGGGGVFIRIVSTSGSVAAGLVTAVGMWADVRGVERYVTALTAATAVGLLPASIAEGQALKILASPGGLEGSLSCLLLNYDTVAHGAGITVEVAAAGGLSSVIPVSGAVAAGSVGTLFDAETATGHHTTGGNINVTDATATTTTTPAVMIAVARTNQGTVRPDQGGAF